LKIDICMITSTPHLESHASLGDRHLCLAHMVHKDEQYAEFYFNSSKYLIMDNSAFEFEEEGRGVPQDLVLDAAKLVDPDEICAIDILFNGPDTVASVKDFMKYVHKKDPYRYDSTRFMAIPQGESEDEWLECYEKLVQLEDIDVIGFSKLSVPESFHGNHHDSGNCSRGRIKCIDFLHEHKMTPDVFGKEMHLLGSDNVGVNELQYYYDRDYKFIRSNDTSMPFVYGYTGNEIHDGYVDEIVMEKLDFNKVLTEDELKSVDHNFTAWRAINA
jgi:hypothetical protein